MIKNNSMHIFGNEKKISSKPQIKAIKGNVFFKNANLLFIFKAP